MYFRHFPSKTCHFSLGHSHLSTLIIHNEWTSCTLPDTTVYRVHSCDLFQKHHIFFSASTWYVSRIWIKRLQDNRWSEFYIGFRQNPPQMGVYLSIKSSMHEHYSRAHCSFGHSMVLLILDIWFRQSQMIVSKAAKITKFISGVDTERRVEEFSSSM